MEINEAFQIVVGLAIAIGGWFFKRIFKLLDDGAEKMNSLEVDVAMLKVQSAELHDRLDRIETKIDKLLER